MQCRIKTAVLAVASVFPLFAAAQGGERLEPVVVTATRVEMSDVDAPYASEVHGRRDIERSGAVSLMDYLARHSSVNVLPQWGNRFSPGIDMRGYGIGDGYQNVVVSVNGRRLNNIDQVSQLLGGISLADIERIEIIKGSGSVLYGDGAMAGSIQIHTRAHSGVSLEGYVGSHGASGLNASAGVDLGRFAFSASAEKSDHDGFSKKDPSGHRDASESESWQVSLSGQPSERLRLSLDAGQTRIDARYPGPLTLAQFRDDPSQNNPAHWSGGVYNHQYLKTDYWQAGAELDLSQHLSLSLSHSREDKTSEFEGWGSDYDYDSTDLALQYSRDGLVLTTGYQRFDGRRTADDNRTDKDNEAWFVQGQYALGRLLLSAGWRTEKVKYAYRPELGATQKDDLKLKAWDLGANYRLDDVWTMFANYNSAFQAPDIDRFFLWGGAFNGFIEPAKARTLNLGFNRVTDTHRLKATVFHSRVRDEIYYNPLTWANTNIDRSKKYGLELQNSWLFSERYTLGLNYVWTRATIERDESGAGAFNGKNLPGVSRHSAIVSLNAKVGENGNLNLSHSWRSKAYAIEDFANDYGRVQRAYNSTDVSYRHRFAHDVEVYAAVGNLFDRKNGVWVHNDAIYPVDFERTWRIGAKISF